MGFGNIRYTAHQQAAPPTSATQMVSALPVARTTRHKAVQAPTQTGSKKMPINIFAHFGTSLF